MSEEKLLDNLLLVSLGAKEGDRIGLIHDLNYKPIADRIRKHCTDRGLPVSQEATAYRFGAGLEDDIRQMFIGQDTDVLIIATQENMWHLPERKRSKYELRKRLVNILDPSHLCESFKADVQQMKHIGEEIRKKLNAGSEVRIVSESGTDLTAEIGRVFCETGDYTQGGSGGDFPAGEVGFGPIEHSVHGELVYDFKIQHVGLVEDDHHRLHVEADEIQIVHGSNEFEELVSRYPTLRCISEVSFGINPVWTQVDSPHSIVEEKNLGTVHFGAGGNFSYGNRKGPHFDSVIHSPTVWLDGVPIMQDGRFLETFLSLEVLESIPKMFRGSV